MMNFKRKATRGPDEGLHDLIAAVIAALFTF